MKKNNLKLKWSTILFLIAVFSFSSCTKEVDLWKDQRDNLLGKWAGTADFVKSHNGNEVESGTNEVSLEFFNTEKASIGGEIILNQNVDWIYQPAPERISFSSNFILSNSPHLFEVLENSKNKQVWDTQYETYSIDTSLMIATKYLITEKWTLTRE